MDLSDKELMPISDAFRSQRMGLDNKNVEPLRGLRRGHWGLLALRKYALQERQHDDSVRQENSTTK